MPEAIAAFNAGAVKPKRRKPNKKSPTILTLRELRKLGFTCAIVEKWNPHVKIRQDLFGFIDLLAIQPGVGIIGIQATDYSSHSKRRAKAMNHPNMILWLKSGGRFEIWSWQQKGGKGTGWTFKCEEITTRAQSEWIGSGNYTPPVRKTTKPTKQLALPM